MINFGTTGRGWGYLRAHTLPEPATERVLRFERLSGGMNTRDPALSLSVHETPFAQNLTWRGGALRCRRGQSQIGQLRESAVYAAYETLFHGWIVTHAGDRILAYKARRDAESEQPLGTERSLCTGLGSTGGTFFRYDDALLYKARGAYRKITCDEQTDALRCADLTQDAFVPCIQRNTDPKTGAGDLYQPENRLSAKKIVFFAWEEGVSVYHLPVRSIDDVVYVRAGTRELVKYDHYDVDLAAGTVTLSAALDPDTLPSTNAIEICFEKRNDDAYSSVMDCTTAAVFGGAQELCVVLAGSRAQPNAYFWSGGTSAAMDPTYFPMSQYNLAGDAAEPITGFGKQQAMLVIFQRGSVGRAVFGTARVNDRDQITMDYTRIHASIGCDLPESICLVENNLVWASKRHGVCRLKDSSAAYENNIAVISRKLHGNGRAAGLLHMLARAKIVFAADTGERYVLFLDGEAYEWNYTISAPDNPSWFYHKGLQARRCVTAEPDRLFALTANGRVTEFLPVLMDFAQPIEKIYTLPPRDFGGRENRKTIRSMRFVTCPDTRVDTQITYSCECMSYTDGTNLRAGAWSLVPRSLAARDLSCTPFGRIFRRTPGFFNIAFFGVKLYNAQAGVDLSLISAEIRYLLQGREP